MSDARTHDEQQQAMELEQELKQFDWIPDTMDEVFRDLNAFYVIESRNIQWHLNEKAS